MGLLLCNFSTGTGVARWPDLQFPHNYRIKLRLVIYIYDITLVIMKHPRWNCGHLCPLEALAWASRDRHSWPHAGGLLILGLHLHLTSFWNGACGLERERSCGKQSQVPWWDWKFCFRPWNFDFLCGLSLAFPSASPLLIPLFVSDASSPCPTQIRFLICKSGGCTRSYLRPLWAWKCYDSPPSHPLSLFPWVSWLTGRRKLAKRETGRVVHPPV